MANSEREPTTHRPFKSTEVSQDMTNLSNKTHNFESNYEQIPTFLEISKDRTSFKSFQVIKNQELNPSQAKGFSSPTKIELSTEN